MEKTHQKDIPPGIERLKFHALLRLEGKTATGIQVPGEIVRALGSSKKPPVRVILNGFAYRTTIAAFGEVFMIPVSAEIRKGAGISAGDELEIEIENDTEPREVSVPPDLAEALAQDPEASQNFAGLSYSHKRQHVLAIEDAKTPETRQRRIAKAVTTLHEGKV